MLNTINKTTINKHQNAQSLKNLNLSIQFGNEKSYDFPNKLSRQSGILENLRMRYSLLIMNFIFKTYYKNGESISEIYIQTLINKLQ